jgi:protein-S-isoprenylcysteine O-methyltransferase Ste14
MSTEVRKPSVRTLLLTILYLLMFPAILLLLSGDGLWIEGWLFTAWFLGLCLAAIIYLYRNDPALLAERYNQPGSANQQGWDKYVVYALFFGFIAWIVVMPLDAKRFGWTKDFPVGLQAVGAVALMLSALFLYRSYTDNTFVSPLVRIQADRKQQVVSTGVYGFVRHPMYLGGVLLFIGAPLLLGSMVGLIIGFAMVLLLAGRIIGEERMLVQELDGYDEYKTRVKYRLVPFIW